MGMWGHSALLRQAFQLTYELHPVTRSDKWACGGTARCSDKLSSLLTAAPYIHRMSCMSWHEDLILLEASKCAHRYNGMVLLQGALLVAVCTATRPLMGGMQLSSRQQR